MPLVTMMEAADSRTANDFGVAVRPLGGHSHRRRALGQPEMRPVVVVVRDKLGEKSLHVAFVEDDHVVEQISPHGGWGFGEGQPFWRVSHARARLRVHPSSAASTGRPVSGSRATY